MKDRFDRFKHRSMKVNLIIILSLLIAAVVFSLTLMGVNWTDSLGRSAQQISADALTDQTKEYLLQLTLSSANENDLLFQNILNDAQQLANFASTIFENPSAFDISQYWESSSRLFEGPDGQFMNHSNDISSVFVPNFEELDIEMINQIELSAYLDLVFENVMDKHPETEAIYFATSRNVIRYYPNVNLGLVVPPDFRATNRVWFAGSLPPHNPDGSAWWTPPYVDATGLGLISTAAASAYDRDQNLIGVVGFDVTLTEMINRIEAARMLRTGYAFLIDSTGKAIALPPQGYLHIFGRLQEPDEINIDLTTSKTGFAAIIGNMIRGGSGVETLVVDGKELFIAYAPLPSTGWSMGSVVESQEVTQAVALLQQEFEWNTNFLLYYRVLPVSLAILILVIMLGLFITNRITDPIQQLARAAQKILEGDWDVKLPTGEKNEIGFLAHSFQAMTNQIHKMVRDLEQKVTERTRELEMRSNQLQVAAEIARDATAIRELEIMLSRTANLVKERFNFLYAGIFLLDNKKEHAYLKAAAGQDWNKLFAIGYSMKVGKSRIIDAVLETGKPQIWNESVEGKELSEINPEMALPLIASNEVIGMLHVQNETSSAFTEEDMRILQLLTDQVAIAIDNVRLYQEAKENLEKLHATHDSYSQEAWKHIEKSKKINGFRYEPDGVKPIYNNQVPLSEAREHEKENVFCLPLKIRGRVIGELEVWPQNETMKNEELLLIKAVGERISQALESARLFEESKARAVREQTLNLISSSFTHSLDFDTLLKTAVKEMGSLPNIAEITVHIGQPENPGSKKENDNGNQKSG
jgi:nitrate/nitrite-specific signal transduction histidine kinase